MNIDLLRQSYEEKIRVLQDRYQAELRIKDELINNYLKEITYLRELSLNLSKQEIQIVSNNNHQIEVRTESKSMSEAYESKYNQSRASIGVNVDQAQDGSQITGIGVQHNYAPEQKQTLAEAAVEIQQLLTQLQSQGVSQEQAQERVANDLAQQAQSNSTVKERLMKWGQYLSDAAANGLIGEATVEVLKLALKLSGIPLP